MKKSYYFTTSYDGLIENMITNNIVGSNIEAEKSEFEATIEMKLDEIKSEHIKNIKSLE